MKKQEISIAVVTGAIGIIASYFIFKLILPSLGTVSFWNLNSSSSGTLSDPNPDVFNYRAINPTLEVYVGEDTNNNTKPESEPGPESEPESEFDE